MKKLIIMSVSLVVTLGVVVAGVSASDREFTSITEPLVAVSSPTEDQEGNKESKNQSSDLITPEEAGEIALDYLGTGMIEEIELEQKKGRLAYEVEIDTYDEDGDIYVDARTGEILYVEDDLGKMLNKKNTHPETTDNKGNMLTREEAIEVAFNHVGKGDIDDFELETKGGKVVFEIEIEQQDDQEVEVKIDAFTGEILSVKWDD